MRRLIAATLLELVAAITIMGIIAAIVFVATGPAREAARQTTCIHKLRQIYVALAAYSNDNSGPDPIPGMGGIKPYVPPLLAQYGADDSTRYCPDLPDEYKDRLGSSYVHRLAALPAPGSSISEALGKEIREAGQATEIVWCTIHDQCYYQPRERNIDARFLAPFVLSLRLDGSIVSGRRPGMQRSKLLSLIGER